MSGLDSKNRELIEVECHSGFKNDEKPKRVKLNDTWYEIFQISRQEVIEDYHTRDRSFIYYCHIGDNIIVKLIKDKNGWSRA